MLPILGKPPIVNIPATRQDSQLDTNTAMGALLTGVCQTESLLCGGTLINDCIYPASPNRPTIRTVTTVLSALATMLQEHIEIKHLVNPAANNANKLLAMRATESVKSAACRL